AQRPLLLLTRGIRADRRPGNHGAGVDRQLDAVDERKEVIETARRGTGFLLTDFVVFRTVARALGPLRRLAERHATTEVDAALPQRDDAGFHALENRLVLVDLLGLRHDFGVVAGVLLDIGACRSDVIRLAVRNDVGLDLRDRFVDRHLAAETDVP